jgi:hypothetical protein
VSQPGCAPAGGDSRPLLLMCSIKPMCCCGSCAIPGRQSRSLHRPAGPLASPLAIRQSTYQPTRSGAAGRPAAATCRSACPPTTTCRQTERGAQPRRPRVWIGGQRPPTARPPACAGQARPGHLVPMTHSGPARGPAA